MMWETKKRCVFTPQQKRFRAEKERNKLLKQGRIEADERVRYNKQCLKYKLELDERLKQIRLEERLEKEAERDQMN